MEPASSTRGGQRDAYFYRALYGSHFLSAFGDRLWQFAVPILFITIWSNTLLPAALFGFALEIFKVFLLPSVGQLVDVTDRLQLVAWGTFGQNLCISISTLLLVVLGNRVQNEGHDFGESTEDMSLFVVLVLVGIVGDLFSSASSLGIEKDWVVVIAKGDTDKLARLNVTLRRIDLFCKFVAPMTFGLITACPSEPIRQIYIGSAFVIGWAVLSVFPIFFAWRSVYYAFEDLKNIKPKKSKTNFLIVFARGFSNYWRSAAFGASLGYCCLYFTVLSDHHPLSTAYLRQQGVGPALLGAARGGGALTGMIGTFLYPRLRASVGVIKTNVIAAWLFVACIWPICGLYMFDMLTAKVRANFMLCAIVCSRIFLWCFDLANVQVMQESTAESSRGEINAVQGATCQLMELMMATLGLVFFAPRNFPILFYASAFGVGMAAVLVTVWAVSPGRFKEASARECQKAAGGVLLSS